MSFTINKRLSGTGAGKTPLGRAGTLTTAHGVIETPAFVAVGTKATLKALTPAQIEEIGVSVVLGNTYHLYLQPGDDIVKRSGGFNKFMHWNGPSMTDSGGFQVFSLGAAFGKGLGKILKGNNEPLLPVRSEAEDAAPKIAKIDADGVMFRSHLDGSAHYITPEKSIDIQHNIGADIIFAFDECTSPIEPLHYQKEALDRTHRWAKRSLARHREGQKNGTSRNQLLFGIVQGGRHEELRKESAAAISAMDFDGFGIGGSFAKEDMSGSVRWVNENLPEEKPRHLLGIGEPLDLLSGIENGVDLFDCVAPTRNGRTGTLYTKHGKLNITNAQFTEDFSPLEEHCGCYTCKNFSRAYISHLFRAKEMLAATLASIHNLYFITHLVKNARTAILNDSFDEFSNNFRSLYKAN